MSPSPSRTRDLRARAVADERARFVVVGAVNTLVGYGLFAGFERAIDSRYSYVASLYGSYAIATILAFFLHRRYTYRKTGTRHILVDFIRFQGVYAASLALNSVALPALVELAHMGPLIAQAIVVCVTTILSYFGHKYFSFRRSRPDSPEP